MVWVESLLATSISSANRFDAKGKITLTDPVGAFNTKWTSAMNDAPCQEPFGILIVDDDTEMTAGLSELLESYGYRTWVAHSLEEAAACIGRHAPHCALIDAKLGAQSGVRFAAQLLASERTGPRVVIMSGRAPDSEDLQVPGIGQVSWLMKPVDIERLLEQLRPRRSS